MRTKVLVILDGWGMSASREHNAILQAKTPNWDHCWQHYPHTQLEASGFEVGLPQGQMGNSEVGHLTLGAGRIILQELTRLDQAVVQGDFGSNEVFNQAILHCLTNNSALHIAGLLSEGGVHSHERHIHALLDLAVKKGLKKIYVHAFLDGRDTPPRSARHSLDQLELKLNALACGKIVSCIGRYYAMDRDKRWGRIEQAFNLIVHRQASFHVDNAGEALALAYARDENDEFVQATTIGEADAMQADDVLIMMNFRADRMRQLSSSMLADTWCEFDRGDYHKPFIASLSAYFDEALCPVAFPVIAPKNTLAEYLAKHKKRQYRIAETEKYAHVTYFFNGGIEQLFALEERELIASPKVATYDLQPEMSAIQITEKLCAAIKTKQYDLIVCNYANPDMVGHTGDMKAAIQAVEVIDKALGEIINADKEAEILITADHGNVECMFDDKHAQAHTAHTLSPVPLVYIGPRKLQLKSGGLSDVAPTLLHLMGLAIPKEMTGNILVKSL